MAGELLRELQGADEKRNKERTAKNKRTRELKTHDREQWLKQEKETAEKIIADIPFKAREREKSVLTKKKLQVCFLMPEFLRGVSTDTLDGAGKIVYDWCVEEGFEVELIPYSMGSVSMEISW